MKFIVTGSNGFAGKHLVALLQLKGHEAVGNGLDITDAGGVYTVFNSLGKINGIFNLAAKTHPPTSFDQPLYYFKNNALGTITLIETMRRYQPDCVFMNCSTSEVYGINPENVIITENTPLKPQNPYAVSKASADMYCTERFVNGFSRGFTTRAFSHTGPGRPENYSISSDAIQIARILKCIQKPIVKVGNLKCKRVVMDVRDVVDVYYQLMMKQINGFVANGEIYNISGDNLRSMGFFLDLMADMYNLDIIKEIDDKLYRKIDIPVQLPSSSKVRKLLNWSPSIKIEKTLTDLVEWHLHKI